MLRWVAFAAVVSAGVVGCADVCHRAQTLNERFPETHAACFAPGTLEPAAFDAGACTTSMRKCSDADQAAVQRYLDCLEQLPPCHADEKEQFSSAFLKCASGISGISDGCFQP